MADIICYYLSIEWMTELSRLVERASTIQIGKRTQSMGWPVKRSPFKFRSRHYGCCSFGGEGGGNLAWSLRGTLV